MIKNKTTKNDSLRTEGQRHNKKAMDIGKCESDTKLKARNTENKKMRIDNQNEKGMWIKKQKE